MKFNIKSKDLIWCLPGFLAPERTISLKLYKIWGWHMLFCKIMKKRMSEYGLNRHMLTPTTYVNLSYMSYNLSEIVPEIGDHFFVSSHACDGVLQTSFPGGGVSRLLTLTTCCQIFSLTLSWFSSSASSFLVFIFLNSLPSSIILFVFVFLILFVGLGFLPEIVSFCSSFLPIVCQ